MSQARFLEHFLSRKKTSTLLKNGWQLNCCPKGENKMAKTIEQTQKDKIFSDIAKDSLFIETLETRNSDSLDFHDCSVWGIKEALEAAYAAGKAAA